MTLPTPQQLLTSLAARCGFESADMSAPTIGWIQRDGLKLRYLDWRGEGPPILFLHGGTLTAHTWDYVCLNLRAHYRCIALDLRGHGDSDWSEDYRIEAAVEDVHALQVQLGISRMHVVGMSLGGNVAAHYIASYPSAAATLVLVDVGPGVDFAATAGLRNFVMNVDGITDLPQAVEMAMRVNPRGDRDKVWYRLLHSVALHADGTYRWKIDRRKPHDYDHILSKLEELTMFAADIRAPVLVVRGARSKIFSLSAAERCARLFPFGSMVEVSNAGHSVQEDNPHELSEALRQFFVSSVQS